MPTTHRPYYDELHNKLRNIIMCSDKATKATRLTLKHTTDIPNSNKDVIIIMCVTDAVWGPVVA